MQVDQDKIFSVRQKYKPTKEICARINFLKIFAHKSQKKCGKIPVLISIVSIFFRVQSECQKSRIMKILQVLEDFLIK